MDYFEFEMDEDQVRRLVACIVEDYLNALNRYNSHHVAVESVQDGTLDRICKHGSIELENYSGTMH